MAEIKDLERLKKTVESLKTEIDRAKGARDEALRNLKAEFEVKDLKEAKALLEKLVEQEEEGKSAFEEAFEAFEEEYGERLHGK